MITKLLIAVGILVLAIIGYATTKPNTFTVRRSTKIKAAPEKIAPLINDFHQWSAWSPFEKLDPTMQKNFSGTNTGVGAVYEWNGNKKAGAGRMEILESSPTKIGIKLDFSKPFKSNNMSEFVLSPSGNETEVSWSMSGPATLISKIMSLFIDMDTMIGKDFERGLTTLKMLAEEQK